MSIGSNRPWEGIAGVYYPDQMPPRSVKLAKPQSLPPEQVKEPKRRERMALKMDEKHAARIAREYKKTKSIKRTCQSLGVGVRTVYRALEQAGIEPSKPGGAPRK